MWQYYDIATEWHLLNEYNKLIQSQFSIVTQYSAYNTYFFWFIFSHIPTEYEDLHGKLSCSVGMRETYYSDIFHVGNVKYSNLAHSLKWKKVSSEKIKTDQNMAL